MLVDAQGDEVSIDEHDDGPPSLTRGLVAQGFYEVSVYSACIACAHLVLQYVSEPSTAASHLERHKATIPDSRDESLDDTPSSPIDTVVLQTSEQPQSADEKHSKDADTADADRPTSPQAVVHAAPDTSADYLDESSILSSVIVVASDDANGEEGSSAYEQQSTVTDADLLEPSRLVNSPIPDTADTVTNKHILPLPVFPAPATVRTRQTSTNSLLKPSNPIEAYLKSDLPYEPQDDLDARDVIEIEDGQWSAKIPPFHVAIPSYSQRRVTGSGGEYTVFQVISSITLPNRQSQAESSEGPDSSDQERSSPAQHPEVRQIIVDRRYTHFQHLHTILKASLPLLTMPDLPEKRLTGNFNPDFLNTRRRDLGRYLSRLARHELVRSNKAFLDFLGNENEEAYDSSLPRMLMQALRSEPESFFTRIKHDSDYFDEQQLLEEVTEEHDRMARHVRAVEKGQATSAIYDGLSQYRERLQGMYSLFPSFLRKMDL